MKIVVMGAGIIGISTAWYLLEAGHEVTVIDRQKDAALETSFANGAQISVSPLTWSHATLITTSIQYRLRHAELSGAQVPVTLHAEIDGASA